ncbi:MAG: hypothetical protein R3Y35_09990 [Clostridia bacterium]
MNWISLVIFLCLASGAVLIIGIDFNDVKSIFSTNKSESLKDYIEITTGKQKRNFISKEMLEVEKLLKATNREDKFEFIKRLSFFLFILGAVISVLMNNLFLIPVLGTGMALAPFWYIKSTANMYKKKLNEQMESAVSIITTSYLRTEDLVKSVRENITYIESPIRDIFESFLLYSDMLDANIISSINMVKERSENDIFHEWCDCLILCQSDRSMKYLLTSIISKFSDVRIVSSELEAIIEAPKREAFMMMFLVACNIPILYFLNENWFNTLIYTDAGKLTIAICISIILFSLSRILNLSKPIEYRGKNK